MESIADFALQNKAIIIKIHLFAAILTLGAVLTADIFFARLVKKLTASSKELKILKSFSKIIWLGLSIIVPTGILIILSDTQTYFSLPRILAKMIVIIVIITNGILLNTIVSPKLSSMPFRELMLSTEKSTRKARRLMFALGSISTVSWWSAFLLGYIKFIPLHFQTILIIYLFFITTGILTSQVLEKIISGRKI